MIIENKFKEFKNFNYYFFIYLSFLAFCAIIHLYTKHDVGNDSSISEWIINYQGGLTRRGLLGEICFHIAKFFSSELRFVIFIFQSISYVFLLILNYYFFKDIKQNILTVFAILTPIFILYPIAEIESLGRKEVFLYIYFLGVIYFCNDRRDYNNNLNKYILIITPIICLIYEQVTLFFPFAMACLVFHKKIKTLRSFLKTCFLFVPALLIVIYFFVFPLSMENHEIMKQSLMVNFDERCYMSCHLLRVFDLDKIGFIIDSTYGNIEINEVILWIFRYFLIFLIGFFPLLFLSTFSNISITNFFSVLKLNNIFFF